MNGATHDLDAFAVQEERVVFDGKGLVRSTCDGSGRNEESQEEHDDDTSVD